MKVFSEEWVKAFVELRKNDEDFQQKAKEFNNRLQYREEQLQKLESAIKAGEEFTTKIQDENTELKIKLSESETKLEKGRKAAEEKLGLFNEVQQNLTVAFKVLSLDTLKSNNQSFLELETLEKFQEGVQEISNLGKTLYDRITTLAGHFSNVGKSLDRAVDNYNKAVGSLEGQVLVAARKFKELGASTGSDLGTLESVDRFARPVQLSDISSFATENRGKGYWSNGIYVQLSDISSFAI